MNHIDHVNLLSPADLPPGGVWADFGAGSGAFTLALRELVGPEANIYAVDRDRARLNELLHEYQDRFIDPEKLHIVSGDFSRALDLPPLDGVVMANSLHYFKDREKMLRHVRTILKPNGLILLVEYNTDSGNPWVPYPISFESYRTLALRAGFTEPRLLARHPSNFLTEFYSALAYKKGN